MSILITGGTGSLGIYLAKAIREQYPDNIVLFDYRLDPSRLVGFENKVTVVSGNVAYWPDVVNTIQKYGVKEIFHLAAILSTESMQNPFASFKVNLEGTINILEAARILKISKIIFPSTVASFGPGLPEPVDENAPQIPTNLYGITKLSGELWGRYYHQQYDIDFRALRFSRIVNAGRTGSGVALFPSRMIEDAILNLAPASVAAGGLEGEIKKGKDKAVMRANAAHKILQKDLNALFQSNPKFGFEFVYEAMTGEVKFGGNLGTCTHFLTCEFDGENAHLIPVTNAQYVNKILKRTKVSVRFKTTSEKKGGAKTGRYKYWSVVGLVTNKLLEEIDAAGDLLTEGIISNIIQKVKDFASRIWNGVKEWVSKSWQNLLDFLGFEPVVSFNNRISFAP